MKKPIDLELITGVKIGGKRDDTTWSLLDRRGDSFDKKTGELVSEGRPQPHVANIATVLRHDPTMAGKLRYDEFARRCWFGTKKLEDGDEVRFTEWMGNVYALHANPARVNEVMNTVAMDSPYHPVRDYLDGLRWDGEERLDGLLPTYFGVEDTPTARAYGRKTLIACVARVRDPGSKVDTVLVLCGEQGKYKSTGLEALVGKRDGWFADDTLAIGDKDAPLSIQGKLIYEISELDSFRGRDLSTVKAFLSRRIDHFRPPFGRRADDYPRQTVFVGSTNDEKFLNDHTGSRRYWPVKTGIIRVVMLREHRDQLWAEADALYRAGGDAGIWWLSEEEDEKRKGEADDFSESDAWADLIADWLETRAPVSAPTMDDILDFLEIPKQGRNSSVSHRIGRLMVSLGYSNRAKREETKEGRRLKRRWRKG